MFAFGAQRANHMLTRVGKGGIGGWKGQTQKGKEGVGEKALGLGWRGGPLMFHDSLKWRG